MENLYKPQHFLGLLEKWNFRKWKKILSWSAFRYVCVASKFLRNFIVTYISLLFSCCQTNRANYVLPVFCFEQNGCRGLQWLVPVACAPLTKSSVGQKLGKTHFGILLPFRLTLPAWGQYFRLICTELSSTSFTELMSTTEFSSTSELS